MREFFGPDHEWLGKIKFPRRDLRQKRSLKWDIKCHFIMVVKKEISALVWTLKVENLKKLHNFSQNR